jgi:GntR family transcriptional regulator
LPSIRNLARDLKISVITTKRAYEELEKEGLIYSVAGKGFYVDNPDTAYLTEKKVQGVEQQLEAVLALCRQADLSKEDVKDMIDILWEES